MRAPIALGPLTAWKAWSITKSNVGFLQFMGLKSMTTINALKARLFAVIFTAVFSNTIPAYAQSERSFSISSNLAGLIARNPENFSRQIIQEIYSISRSGIVTQEILQQVRSFKLARIRADELVEFLRVDIDGDFDVDEDDFNQLSALLDSRKLANLRITNIERDQNGDGTVTLAEIY